MYHQLSLRLSLAICCIALVQCSSSSTASKTSFATLPPAVRLPPSMGDIPQPLPIIANQFTISKHSARTTNARQPFIASSVIDEWGIPEEPSIDATSVLWPGDPTLVKPLKLGQPITLSAGTLPIPRDTCFASTGSKAINRTTTYADERLYFSEDDSALASALSVDEKFSAAANYGTLIHGDASYKSSRTSVVKSDRHAGTLILIETFLGPTYELTAGDNNTAPELQSNQDHPWKNKATSSKPQDAIDFHNRCGVYYVATVRRGISLAITFDFSQLNTSEYNALSESASAEGGGSSGLFSASISAQKLLEQQMTQSGASRKVAIHAHVIGSANIATDFIDKVNSIAETASYKNMHDVFTEAIEKITNGAPDGTKINWDTDGGDIFYTIAPYDDDSRSDDFKQADLAKTRELVYLATYKAFYADLDDHVNDDFDRGAWKSLLTSKPNPDTSGSCPDASAITPSIVPAARYSADSRVSCGMQAFHRVATDLQGSIDRCAVTPLAIANRHTVDFIDLSKACALPQTVRIHQRTDLLDALPWPPPPDISFIQTNGAPLGDKFQELPVDSSHSSVPWANEEGQWLKVNNAFIRRARLAMHYNTGQGLTLQCYDTQINSGCGDQPGALEEAGIAPGPSESDATAYVPINVAYRCGPWAEDNYTYWWQPLWCPHFSMIDQVLSLDINGHFDPYSSRAGNASFCLALWTSFGDLVVVPNIGSASWSNLRDNSKHVPSGVVMDIGGQATYELPGDVPQPCL